MHREPKASSNHRQPRAVKHASVGGQAESALSIARVHQGGGRWEQAVKIRVKAGKWRPAVKSWPKGPKEAEIDRWRYRQVQQASDVISRLEQQVTGSAGSAIRPGGVKTVEWWE